MRHTCEACGLMFEKETLFDDCPRCLLYSFKQRNAGHMEKCFICDLECNEFSNSKEDWPIYLPYKKPKFAHFKCIKLRIGAHNPDLKRISDALSRAVTYVPAGMILEMIRDDERRVHENLRRFSDDK